MTLWEYVEALRDMRRLAAAKGLPSLQRVHRRLRRDALAEEPEDSTDEPGEIAYVCD